jgi:hypothetical protein
LTRCSRYSYTSSMPRQVDYPRRSLAQSLDLAAAVDSLGGQCSEDVAANRLGRKGASGGAFNALVAAAVKYGLVESRKNTLTLTPGYRDIKLAYDDDQRTTAMRAAFLTVPLFRRVYERFIGKSIPEDILDKLLIREFEVPEALASRVGEYFLEGARLCRLLNDAGIVVEDGANTGVVARDSASAGIVSAIVTDEPKTSYYSIRMTGPGISTTIDVRAEEDLLIVDAVLGRIRRSLKAEQA